MKIIFLTAFQPFISRNILSTGVLDELTSDDVKVVIFCPLHKKQYYTSKFSNQKVEIVGIETDRALSLKERFFKGLSNLLLDTTNKKLHKMELYVKNNSLPLFVVSSWFTEIFANIRLVRRFYCFADYHLNRDLVFSDYFKLYTPNVVFTPDVFGDFDVSMLKAAKKNKVRSVGMVLSWDNNTSKTLMRVIPDRLIVQNEVIKDEAINLHDVPESRIVVSGIPHYDYYKEYQPIGRQEFFSNLGVDPDRRLVVIAPAGEKFIKSDWHVFKILQDAYNNGEIDKKALFLIRVHPSNKIDFGEFVSDENFLVEDPGVSFKDVRSKDNELDLDAVNHLADTLKNSAVVINVVSSLVIDAAVFDRPVITVGFDGWMKNVPYIRSVKAYLEIENMEKLLSVGATPVVKNGEDLISWVNKYLSNPEIHQLERRRLIERQCWKLDGQSKKRIAKAVLEI